MTEAAALKDLMETFLQERLNKKLDELQKEENKKSATIFPDDELEKLKDEYEGKKQSLIDSYQLEVWLDDAAKRVQKISEVTHAIKYQNPYATGSCIYSVPTKKQNYGFKWVTTESINHPITDAVCDTAADWPVYMFLQKSLSDDNETLLSRMLRNDEALRTALPSSKEKKDGWFQSFCGLKELKGRPSTSSLAKQLYFPVGENQYHLLAPLFPTSLVHKVYLQVQTRFDDATKDARNAKKEGRFHLHGYREYPNLAVQKFGGANKQNISQLNMLRNGKAFLLPSLPPSWNSVAIRAPFGVESVFPIIFAGKVKRLTHELKTFLVKVKDRGSNAGMRQTRAELVGKIIDELLQYSSEVQGLSPGWSAKPECLLNQAQLFWLDPERADDKWQHQRDATDWERQISHEFANWLNATLQTDHLRFGDDERLEWKKLLQKELVWLTPEIAL